MAPNSACHRNEQPTNRIEDFLVFGYSCKIFRDDEKATFIDERKHLIPWREDNSLMIDKYDVRNYLHDLAPYEAKIDYDLDKVETGEELLYDEERYLSLRFDVSEEDLYHEEEMKRHRAAAIKNGAYHEVGFSYESTDKTSESAQLPLNKESIEEPYVAPEGLRISKGILMPPNMKTHVIIEKTALFICQHGGQMEVIIKMKQSGNPQFEFMSFDNSLHPYYKLLLQELKAGQYKPVMEKKSEESDDDYDDGHYLHPSLISRNIEDIPKFTIPVMNFRKTGCDSYSVLVAKLKPSIDEDICRSLPSDIKSSSSLSDSSYSSDSENSLPDHHFVPLPPPDVQPIIDKMAEYVAKNGKDFETIVKSKSDTRFDFLNQGYKYYGYYKSQRNKAAQRISRTSEKMLKQCRKEHMSPQEEPIYVRVIESKPPAQSNALLSSTRTCNHGSHSPDCSGISSSDLKNPGVKIYSSAHVHPKTQLLGRVNDYNPDAIKSSGSEVPPNQGKVKTLKGPISFSLKCKKFDLQISEKSVKRTRLFLGDSDDETAHVCEDDFRFQSSKRLKAAKEKVKNELTAAAQEKEAKQLERKLKAAVFVKMLQAKKLHGSASNDNVKPSANA